MPSPPKELSRRQSPRENSADKDTIFNDTTRTNKRIGSVGLQSQRKSMNYCSSSLTCFVSFLEKQAAGDQSSARELVEGFTFKFIKGPKGDAFIYCINLQITGFQNSDLSSWTGRQREWYLSEKRLLFATHTIEEREKWLSVINWLIEENARLY